MWPDDDSLPAASNDVDHVYKIIVVHGHPWTSGAGTAIEKWHVCYNSKGWGMVPKKLFSTKISLKGYSNNIMNIVQKIVFFTNISKELGLTFSGTKFIPQKLHFF